MSDMVIVISEWLPKPGKQQALLDAFKELASTTLEHERECLKYHVTQQVEHPNATGESKYTILLIQEYTDVEAFDVHCNSEHVQAFAKRYFVEDDSLIEDWRCRLFSPQGLKLVHQENAV